MLGPATLQIGLIASSDQTSGSDRYYFDLIRSLRASGARADGVVLGDPSAIDAPLDGIRSFAPEGSDAVRRWTGLRRTVRPLVCASDVVVSHMAAHAFPVLDLLRERPLVAHFHGPWALEGRYARLSARTVALRYLQERSVYGRAKRVVALSGSFAEVLRRNYGVARDKIVVVPGGVDVNAFAPNVSRREARDRLGLPADRQIVFCVRRLESTKGIDRLIDAMALLKSTLPDVLLVVAGTGSLADSLARHVASLDLATNVTFAGKIADAQLALAYRAADVSVVPSQAWEGFGLVTLESLASGTPAMVTPVGGLPEAVRELSPSLVFAGLGAAEIADGLRAALSGASPLPAEDACVRYASRFAWSEIAARVDRVYRDVA